MEHYFGGDGKVKDDSLALMVLHEILWEPDFKSPEAWGHHFFQIRGKEVTKAENVTKKVAPHVWSLAMLRN